VQICSYVFSSVELEGLHEAFPVMTPLRHVRMTSTFALQLQLDARMADVEEFDVDFQRFTGPQVPEAKRRENAAVFSRRPGSTNWHIVWLIAFL